MMSLGAKRKRGFEVRASKSGKRIKSTVGPDALRWKQVAITEKLEDAEGFFGLEEIEDVDVVREEGKDGVFFRPSSDNVILETEQDEWDGFEEYEEAAVETQQKPTDTTNGKVASADELSFEPGAFAALIDEGIEDDDTDGAWTGLGLTPLLREAVARTGFEQPTPIQIASIPQIIQGYDIIGKAVTGSGKTLAFGLPILNMILCSTDNPLNAEQDNSHNTTALILSPTRELAHQITKHISDISIHLRHRVRMATVTGGLSVLKQQRQLQDADIVVATPGRLWEVIQSQSGLVQRLKAVRFLVIDEADRLLSEGHFKEVEQILDALDRKVVQDDDLDSDATEDEKEESSPRQTLVFSATFHSGLLQKLEGKLKHKSGELLNNQQSMEYLLKKLNFKDAKPRFVDVNPDDKMAKGLTEHLVLCGAMEKDIYMYALLLQQSTAKRTLIFTNSISSVKRLAHLFQNLSLTALALHSAMEQKARLRSLERFSAPKESAILIATDVAARGLDIKDIDTILHYHVPRSADMYVHRSGRTARAGKEGQSIMLCAPGESQGVTRLVQKVHKERPIKPLHVDRRIVGALQPRMALARKITDATAAREKSSSQDNWVRTAAEELGVEYDSEEFAEQAKRMTRGRAGKDIKNKRKGDEVSKADVVRMRAQLKDLLSRRVNLGVSEKYIAGGRVDMNALLNGKADRNFLGMETIV